MNFMNGTDMNTYISTIWSPHCSSFHSELTMWSLLALISCLLDFALGYSSLASLENSSKILSRQRRFLVPQVTKDWTFTVKFTLKFPLEGLDTTFDANVPFSFSFNPSTLGRKKRDVIEPIDQRTALIETVEKYIPSVMPMPQGVSNHDCMLRALCEVAQTPDNSDGLLGDFVNLLLAPSYLLDRVNGSFVENDYIEAQRYGHFLQDCSRYERSCPISFFEFEEVLDHQLLYP